ncbi:MAG: 50S ribosomal protein L25/general stress protein Ctc [Cyclobacteriaceae bacterium]|jgi:large subunit ribosomal protein L25|nr:50S ribosomal protein L25/general stress protein Ctc [Cyclobacteriaceae bacterium]
MKTIEIIGYKRANLGKVGAQRAREEGNVPCVLYGGGEQVHFVAPMILFRELVYTNDAHFVHLNIEGEEHQAILQDVQFHPVSEIILHADFLQINEGRKIKMEIPIRLIGQAAGVSKGGTLARKKASLKVQGFPKDMPEHIDVDVTSLDFHHAIKVMDMKIPNLTFLDPKRSPIAVVEVPRAAKMAADEAAAAAAAPAAAAPAETEEAKKEAPKK